jgi:hypothetical protein
MRFNEIFEDNHMNPVTIFLLQFSLSLLVIGLLAKWALVARLNRLPRREALFWLIVPHTFRHIGLVFLVPGIVDSQLPTHFATSAAYGDLAAGLLAITALIALRSGKGIALPIVWLFNIVGTVDLVHALASASAIPYLNASWFIPTFFVPLLLVTHFLIFVRLLRRPATDISAGEQASSTHS